MTGKNQTPEAAGPVADAVTGNWVDRLAPPRTRPYLRLARADRPIGTWLLLLPCWWGLLLGMLHDGRAGWHDLWIFAGCGIGAWLMRGAGCTWNDITDRHIDGSVARTAQRPIPSGQVSVKQALAWLVAQALVALCILLTFNMAAIALGVLALLPVAIYPFAKRFTWWPQIFLGLAFNWGALLAWTAHTGRLEWPAVVLYLAGIAWTLFYDTIYAHQDKEDDALIGVKSTARLFGKHAALYSFGFFIVAAALIAAASGLQGAGRMGAVTSLVFLGHATAQVSRLKSKGERVALSVFKSNVWTGAFVALGLMLAAMTPEPTPRTIFSGPEIVPDGQPDKVSLPFGLELKKSGQKPSSRETWLKTDIRHILERDGFTFPDTAEDADVQPEQTKP